MTLQNNKILLLIYLNIGTASQPWRIFSWLTISSLTDISQAAADDKLIRACEQDAKPGLPLLLQAVHTYSH
jgi:hypothetical protein